MIDANAASRRAGSRGHRVLQKEGSKSRSRPGHVPRFRASISINTPGMAGAIEKISDQVVCRLLMASLSSSTDGRLPSATGYIGVEGELCQRFQ